MKAGWIAAWIGAAVLVPGLAGCGGSSSGGAGASGASASPQAQAASSSPTGSATPSSPSSPSGQGSTGKLTPPGAQLGFGQKAMVAWVPPGTESGPGAHRGFRFQVTVVSIEKGTMADFRNVQLNASERKSTPYYVTLRIKALGHTAPPGTDDPAITFDAIDDRGQKQSSVTFFGTFPRCNETTVPKPLANGKSYSSCLTYLMPGGGSIQKVQWGDGPAAADQVTPYFDKPIVWAGG
jgi:hypothetical protein